MTIYYDTHDECVNTCAPTPDVLVVRGLFIDDGDKALGSPRFVASPAGRFIDIVTPAFEGVLHEDEAYPLLKQLSAVLL